MCQTNRIHSVSTWFLMVGTGIIKRSVFTSRKSTISKNLVTARMSIRQDVYICRLIQHPKDYLTTMAYMRRCNHIIVCHSYIIITLLVFCVQISIIPHLIGSPMPKINNIRVRPLSCHYVAHHYSVHTACYPENLKLLWDEHLCRSHPPSFDRDRAC